MFGNNLKDGEACPFMGGKPCLREKCKMWEYIPVEIKGEPVGKDCSIKWQQHMSWDTANQVNFLTASFDKMATEIREANVKFLKVISARVRQIENDQRQEK